jgi:hypothetical protein
MRISYSVVKDLYSNFNPVFEGDNIKEVIQNFLKNKVAIKSYVETLQFDIDLVGDSFDMSSYKKGVIELTKIAESL